MDITSLGNEAIGYLAPAMPFLLATGKTLRNKAIEKVGQTFGEESFKYGKSLGQSLARKSKPNQPHWKRQRFGQRSKRCFETGFVPQRIGKDLPDDALAAEIKQILERKAAGVNVVQSRRNIQMAITITSSASTTA